eukprot:scaffold75525_cov69-Phaeocystis_antarctica.AAC.2
MQPRRLNIPGAAAPRAVSIQAPACSHHRDLYVARPGCQRRSSTSRIPGNACSKERQAPTSRVLDESVAAPCWRDR